MSSRQYRLVFGALISAFWLAAVAQPASATIFFDDDFGGDGIAEVTGSNLAHATGVATLPLGRGVVVVGNTPTGSPRQIVVAHLDPAGKISAEYGGVRTLNVEGLDTAAGGVAVDSSGRVVIAGTVTRAGNDTLVLLRLHHGQLDTTFGDIQSGGQRTGYHLEAIDRITRGRALVISNNEIFVGGTLTAMFGSVGLLQRYNSVGEKVGEAQTAAGTGTSSDSGVRSVDVLADGRIVVAGNGNAPSTPFHGSTQIFTSALVAVPGSLRDANGLDGRDAFLTGVSAYPATHGGFAAGGYSSASSAPAAPQLLWRSSTSAGTAALTDGGGGALNLTGANGDFLTYDAARVQGRSRKLVLAGTSGGDAVLARIDPLTGQPDPSFAASAPTSSINNNGTIRTPLGTLSRWSAIGRPMVEPDGVYIYVAGSHNSTISNQRMVVARLQLATQPTVVASIGGSPFGAGRSPVLVARVNDLIDGGKVVQATVRIDGNVFDAALNLSGTTILPLPPQPTGDHTVTVTATDDEGLTNSQTLTYTQLEYDPAADDDGDGLLNGWEITGDLDGDGKKDIDLPAMGANYRHKDAFVKLDWMKGHALDQTALREVAKGFAEAPVTNPDGKNGISLHLDHGATSLMDRASGKTWGALSTAKELAHVDNLGAFKNATKDGKEVKDAAGNPVQIYDWTDAYALRTANTTELQRKVFTYSISIHQYGTSGSGGRANGIPGDMFLVSRGRSGKSCGDPKIADCNVGTPANAAGTVMHELGHTYSLTHAGIAPSGSGAALNYIPGHRSIMNYLFRQVPDASALAELTFDYSRHTTSEIPSLDEAKLSESAGVKATGSAAGLRSLYVCGGTKKDDVPKQIRQLTFGKETDWDCDGKIEKKATVKTDITADDKYSTLPVAATTEWSRLDLGPNTPANTGDSSYDDAHLLHEPTLRELQQVTRTLSKDRTAPTLKLKAPVGKLRASKAFALRPQASDARGISHLQIWVDGRLVQTVRPSSPKTLRGGKQFSPQPKLTLPKGTHRIDVIVIDRNGNLEGSSQRVTVR